MARPRPGDIVSRRKWLVMHKGIALGDGRVLHNTPFRGEHICSEAEVRAGKRFVVVFEAASRAAAKATAVEMCEKLLANTVIESYTIELG